MIKPLTLLALLLSPLFLVACSPFSPAPVLTPTSTATVPETAVPPTRPTASPTPTSTTLAAVHTLTPTFTVLPASSTPVPTVTLSWEERDAQNLVQLSGQTADGHWRWWVERSRYGWLLTRIAQTSSGVEWSAKVPDVSMRDLETNNAYYRPVFKLPKEPYLYLALTFCCTKGQVMVASGAPGVSLARLNLDTGSITQVIGGIEEHIFYFSPRARYLADYQPRKQLRFIRLMDGKTTDIELSAHYNVRWGEVAWSLDNEEALFMTFTNDLEEIPVQLVLIRVDIRSARFQKVADLMNTLSLNGLEYIPDLVIEWNEENQAHISTAPGSSLKKEWLLDLKTGQVISK